MSLQRWVEDAQQRRWGDEMPRLQMPLGHELGDRAGRIGCLTLLVAQPKQGVGMAKEENVRRARGLRSGQCK